MKDMVSLIIPVYNRQDMVEACVRSALEQSYWNQQIILIDDGSTDRTVEICRKLAETDPRVELLTADHGGVSAARNLGLEQVRGEYVFFLDSDDVIHPMLLETLVDGMESTGAQMGGSGIVQFRENQWSRLMEKIAEDSRPGEYTYHSNEDAVNAMFRWTTPINLIGGVMMRTSLIGQTRFRKDLHIGEDFQFIYDNLIKGTSVVFLKQRWYYSRIHSGNSSWDYGYSGFWTRFHRRELVWKSEERLGRLENAKLQKRDAVAIFLRFLSRTDWNGVVRRKMCRTVKPYYRELAGALTFPRKVLLWTGIHMPPVAVASCRLKDKLRGILKKKQERS